VLPVRVVGRADLVGGSAEFGGGAGAGGWGSWGRRVATAPEVLVALVLPLYAARVPDAPSSSTCRSLRDTLPFRHRLLAPHVRPRPMCRRRRPGPPVSSPAEPSRRRPRARRLVPGTSGACRVAGGYALLGRRRARPAPASEGPGSLVRDRVGPLTSFGCAGACIPRGGRGGCVGRGSGCCAGTQTLPRPPRQTPMQARARPLTIASDGAAQAEGAPLGVGFVPPGGPAAGLPGLTGPHGLEVWGVRARRGGLLRPARCQVNATLRPTVLSPALPFTPHAERAPQRVPTAAARRARLTRCVRPPRLHWHRPEHPGPEAWPPSPLRRACRVRGDGGAPSCVRCGAMSMGSFLIYSWLRPKCRLALAPAASLAGARSTAEASFVSPTGHYTSPAAGVAVPRGAPLPRQRPSGAWLRSRRCPRMSP